MNDLIYNEIVATPGYELEFAAGTTYGLDAEAFLAIALSFARLGEVNDADFQSPFRLLEGLRRANDRIAIFCNRGGLQPPSRMNPLYAMLDKCVFEVADERKGRELANFHPKIWVIKERSLEDRDKRQIKLVVLSRNLTKDTSLDIAVAMTAPLGVDTSAELRRKHQPLRDFLLLLADKADTDKRKKIKKLAKDLDSMGAFTLQPPYEDYELLPFYFGENLNHDINFREELPADRMAVVSPFIDAETLAWINDYHPRQEKLLITRLDSLTPEIMDLYSEENREVWVMSQVAEQNDIQPMNLHAKMFFSWGAKSGGINLWLGSTNATHNGFYRNSEFLLRLKLKRGRNQFESFKAEFCDEKKQMCERVTALPEYESVKEDDSLAVSVRKHLICRNNLSAEVTESDDAYMISIRARRIKDIRGRITFAPIQEPWNESELTPGLPECRIRVTDASHLSEFYILTVKPIDEGVTPVRMVIRIYTSGIPEDRDDRIFRSLIDTRDKFLNYVDMIITDRPQELGALMMADCEAQAMGSPLLQTRSCSNVYESLLQIADTKPEVLEDIQDIANRLDADIVPQTFAQITATFIKAKKLYR